MKRTFLESLKLINLADELLGQWKGGEESEDLFTGRQH